MADNGEQKASTSAGDAGGADPQEVIRALMEEREELRSELEDMQMLATLNEALQEKHKMEMEALQESLAEMSSLQTLNVVLESQQEAELREVSQRNEELEKTVASLQTRVVELEVALEDAKSSGGGGASSDRSAATEAAEATAGNQQKEESGDSRADEQDKDSDEKSEEKQSDEKGPGDASSRSAVATPSTSTEVVTATEESESAKKDGDDADEYVPSKEEEEAMLAVGFSKDQLRDLSRKHSRHAVKSVIFKKQAQLGFMGKERPIEVPESGDKEPETKEELQAAYSKSKEEVEQLRARNSQLELKVDFLGQQVLELQAAQALSASTAVAAPPSSGASTEAATREVPVDAPVSSPPEQEEEPVAVKEAAAPAGDGTEEVVKKTQPEVDYVPSEEETAVLKQLGLSEGQMRSMARKHARHQVRTMIFRKQAALGFLAPEKALKDDAVALGASAQPKPTLANATAVSQSTPVLAVSAPVAVTAPPELQPQAESGDEGMNAEAVKALSGMGYTDSQLRNLSRKHSRHQVKTMIFKKQAMLGFLGGSSVAQQAAGLLDQAEKEVQPANVGRSSLATCSTTAKDLGSTEGPAAPQQQPAEATKTVDKDAPSGDGEGERAAPSAGEDSAAADADASVTVKEEEGDKRAEEVAKPEEIATAGAEAEAGAGGERGDASGGGEAAEGGKKESDEQAKKKKKRKSHHPSSSSGLKTKDEERKERKERRKSRRKTMKAGPLKGESLKSAAAGETADSSKAEETPEEKEAREAKEAEKRERRERRKSKRKTLKPGSSLKSGDEGDKKAKRKSMSSKRKSKKMSSSKLGGDDGTEEPKKGGITFA